ncbi:hypothetical protein EYF80_008949 [Liparis tanakae]|uniref:Uncharacterized protein n=1 Tax=Liparis tanakae TaxID=230148 RepID=A0A4Z2ITT1_9TELE|nr:hypothetical protein EYF80_008949 [Liparis tanakae]
MSDLVFTSHNDVFRLWHHSTLLGHQCVPLRPREAVRREEAIVLLHAERSSSQLAPSTVHRQDDVIHPVGCVFPPLCEFALEELPHSSSCSKLLHHMLGLFELFLCEQKERRRVKYIGEAHAQVELDKAQVVHYLSSRHWPDGIGHASEPRGVRESRAEALHAARQEQGRVILREGKRGGYVTDLKKLEKAATVAFIEMPISAIAKLNTRKLLGVLSSLTLRKAVMVRAFKKKPSRPLVEHK